MLPNVDGSPLSWPGVVRAATGSGVAFVAWLFVLEYALLPSAHLLPPLALAAVGAVAGARVSRLTARESGRSALKTAATGLVNWAVLFPYWFLVTVSLAVAVLAMLPAVGVLPGGVVGQYRFVGYVLVVTAAPAAAFVVALATTLASEGARGRLGAPSRS